MTGIERLQKTGIIRIGTPQRGFTYQRADGTRVSASDVARIQKLRVPPAWIEVAINPSPKGKLQVVGRDNAGRWQYLYHENHSKSSHAGNNGRLAHSLGNLPASRKPAARTLSQPAASR